MRRTLMTGTALTALATSALAGGVERSDQSVAVIFEEGGYAELSFGYVEPSVSGNAVAPLGGFPSGGMTESYVSFGAALKQDVSPSLSFALIAEQPWGADVAYPEDTNYFAQGSVAELNSGSLTGVAKYQATENISVYAGLRYQSFEAAANVPFIPFGGYDGRTETDYGLGYLLGAAYERPEIALRVALTYNSKIKHELETTESSVLGDGNTSITKVETPQSLNLEFQSGVAEDTLVFGSVRWVEWSEFDITPADYEAITGASLVSYDNDVVTYSLGLGRRLNETWSVAGSVAYEAPNGGFSSNLGPTDGRTSVSLAAVYNRDALEISGGVTYAWIGDAQTRLVEPTTMTEFAPASDFTDNSAWGAGLRIGYSF